MAMHATIVFPINLVKKSLLVHVIEKLCSKFGKVNLLLMMKMMMTAPLKLRPNGTGSTEKAGMENTGP